MTAVNTIMAVPRRRSRCMPQPWLTLTLCALLAIALGSVPSSALPCGAFAGEELLTRLDAHLALCLHDGDGGDHHQPDPSTSSFAAAMERIRDRVTTNEFEPRAHRQPLSLVAFSDSAATLDRVAATLQSALLGTTCREAVGVVDFASLLAPRPTSATTASSSSDAKQELRHLLADTLRAAPTRSLLVLRNSQLVQEAHLPVLDVLLDPLNGARAQFHDVRSGQTLDTRHAIFLLLFQTEALATKGEETGGLPWRERLMRHWRAVDGTTSVAFTPQALVGRLTEGLELFTAPDAAPRARLPTACDWARLHATSDLESGVYASNGELFGAVLAVLAMVVCAKSWVAAKRWVATSVAVPPPILEKARPPPLEISTALEPPSSSPPPPVSTEPEVPAVARASPDTEARSSPSDLDTTTKKRKTRKPRTTRAKAAKTAESEDAQQMAVKTSPSPSPPTRGRRRGRSGAKSRAS